MSILYMLVDGVCADDANHSLAKGSRSQILALNRTLTQTFICVCGAVVQYLYRFHLYTTMALQNEHTCASLAELTRVGNGLLKCLQESPLMDVRPSFYLFVKAHLFFCHLVRCIRNIGALSNTDCALMESHHIMTKADGSMTGIHTRLLQIMAVQQRR